MPYRIGEPDRRPKLPAPVVGRSGLLRCNRNSAHARIEFTLWWRDFEVLERETKIRYGPVHQRRMKGMADAKPRRVYLVLTKSFGERRDRSVGACNHCQIR